MADRIFVNDDDLRALGLDRTTGIHSADGKPESPTDQAQRMLREGAPMAAASLLRLAQFSESDTIRLRAATEILNRAQAMGAAADGRDPWDSVYEHVLTPRDVDEIINKANDWKKAQGA